MTQQQPRQQQLQQQLPAQASCNARKTCRNIPEAGKVQKDLQNAVPGDSLARYLVIHDGFAATGIARADADRRVTVFTVIARKALSRAVRQGEHGKQIVTVVFCTKKDRESGLLATTVTTYGVRLAATATHLKPAIRLAIHKENPS